MLQEETTWVTKFQQEKMWQHLLSLYRPTSLLLLPSKLLKRIVHNCLINYLLGNTLLSPCQFGFRHCHSSTQEALLSYATNDWHYHLDSGQSVASVFFNFSKAFDRVPHSQLTSTLSKSLAHFWNSLVLLLLLQPIPERCPQWLLLHHPSRCPLFFSIYMN